MGTSLLSVFIPGKLRNPDNGSHRHWSAVARERADWRRHTFETVRVEGLLSRLVVDAPIPKRIRFRAHLWSLFDSDDGLRSALKSVKDALGPSTPIYRKGRLVGHAPGVHVIHSDAPGCGHEFIYAQIIDRAHRGVEILVEAL